MGANPDNYPSELLAVEPNFYLMERHDDYVICNLNGHIFRWDSRDREGKNYWRYSGDPMLQLSGDLGLGPRISVWSWENFRDGLLERGQQQEAAWVQEVVDILKPIQDELDRKRREG